MQRLQAFKYALMPSGQQRRDMGRFACVFRRIVTADFGIVTGLSGRS
jgi:hypothetical protein